MVQINREVLVSPSVSSHKGQLQKRKNVIEDSCPRVQHLSPVMMPKLDSERLSDETTNLGYLQLAN